MNKLWSLYGRIQMETICLKKTHQFTVEWEEDEVIHVYDTEEFCFILRITSRVNEL